MKFYMIASPEDSLYHDAIGFAGISDTSSALTQFPLTQFTRYANVWYRKASIWINQAVGTWPWDDSNWATVMETSSNLTAGTREYLLPTGTRKIDRLEVLDNSGIYKLLKPLDKSQIGAAMSEFFKTDGLPEYYDLEGHHALLYPTPAAARITATLGLKWYIIRDIKPFTATDTSTEPGFDNHFHRIVSLGAAYDYCLANTIEDRLKPINIELGRLKEELKEHYGSRHRSFRPRMIPRDSDGI